MFGIGRESDPYSRPGYLTPSIVRSALTRFSNLRAVGGGITRGVPIAPGQTVLLAQNDTQSVLSVSVGGAPGFADPVFDVSPTQGGSAATSIRAETVGAQPPRTFRLLPGQELWATGRNVVPARPAVTTVRF
jgi:hypothetical protein